MNQPLYPELAILLADPSVPDWPGRAEWVARVYQLGADRGIATQQLDPDQIARFDAWRAEQDAKVIARQQATRPGDDQPYYGAIGGAYVWTTCFTSLGGIVKVTNSLTEDEIDLTDYENW